MFDGRSGQTPPTPPSPCLPNLRPSQARIEYEPSTNACTDAYPHQPTYQAIPTSEFLALSPHADDNHRDRESGENHACSP